MSTPFWCSFSFNILQFRNVINEIFLTGLSISNGLRCLQKQKFVIQIQFCIADEQQKQLVYENFKKARNSEGTGNMRETDTSCFASIPKSLVPVR